jgi:DNA glycosylase AlkZ-like
MGSGAEEMGGRSPLRRECAAARFASQLLRSREAAGTEEVLERILAIQAQDLRGARLAIRARSTAPSAADVDDALSTRRTAVISWLNRGTLHLVATRDFWWLHRLTTPQLRSGNERRLRQLGLGAREVERGIEAIVAALDERGPQTRTELRDALQRARVRTEGQSLVHLLAAATLRGHIVRGPMRAGDHAYVGTEAWLGSAPDPLDEAEGLGRLARRYLAGHGPATSGDLAKWAGITLGRARTGFKAISPDCEDVGDGLVHLADDRAVHPGGGQPTLPPPRLLGAFDPVLHGWGDRTFVTGDHGDIVTTNGIFRPTALVGGRAVGIWTLSDGRLRLTLLERVSGAAERALRGDARSVCSYLGLAEAEMSIHLRR